MKTTNLIDRNHLQSAILALTFTIFALTILTQANPGTELPSRDYGSYIYAAKEIIQGKLLYKDVWDSKPPAIFYINVLALKIGRGSRWGVWLLEYMFLYCSILASYQLIKKLWGVAPALFGMMIWLLGLNHVLQGGNFTEEYPLVFHFISLIIFLKLLENPQERFYYFLLGVMFSLSFLFRPNNAIVEVTTIFVLIMIRVLQRDFRALLISTSMLAAGILIPVLITAGYFWSMGLLPDLLEASILYNFSYGTTQMSSSLPLIGGFQYLNFSAWVALIGYVLLVFRLRKSFGSPTFYILVILLIGSPLAIYLSDPAKRNYGHYFINWLPFIALLSGLAWHVLQSELSNLLKDIQFPSTLPFVVALIASGIYFFVNGSGWQYEDAVQRILNGPSAEVRSPISIYVENHTRPGEYVLFWATLPGENFMSHRNAPYSSLFYPSFVESSISDRLANDFLQDITTTPPVLVVDMGRLEPLSLNPQKRAEQRPYPPKNLEDVFSFIEKNYYLEAQVKGKNIYRLYGTTQP